MIVQHVEYFVFRYSNLFSANIALKEYYIRHFCQKFVACGVLCNIYTQDNSIKYLLFTFVLKEKIVKV